MVQTPEQKTSHCGTCGAEYLIETGLALPQQPERAASLFNERELETVLAALRLRQRYGEDMPIRSRVVRISQEEFIANAGGGVKALTKDEIGNLCDRLNVETPQGWPYQAPEELTVARLTDIMEQEYEACVGDLDTQSPANFPVFVAAVARDIRHHLGLPADDQERCRRCRALRKYHGDADHDFEAGR